MRIGYLLIGGMLLVGCDRAPTTAPSSATTSASQSATATSATEPTQPAASKPSKARIVSLVPAATEILRQIDALDCVVGVTRYDIPALPPEYQSLPAVGDYESINYERIIGLRPTVIVVQMAADRVPERLNELCAAGHVRLINLKLERLADLQDAAAQLSAAAGEGMTAAVAAQALLMAATRPVENKRPTVVYLVSDVGMMVVGANNFIDDEIAAAGGENIGARCGTGYPIINREKLIELAPDILLIAAPGAAEQDGQADLRLAAWRALPIPAATKGRIYLMTDPDAEMLTLDVGSTMARLRALFAPASPMGAAETKP